MIGSRITTYMRDLLPDWFSDPGYCELYGELDVQGFVSGVQELDQNFIPVLNFWRQCDINLTQKGSLRDFLHKDAAIIVSNNGYVPTTQSVLLRAWLNCTNAAYTANLKGKLYYIGYGYLLDSELKPLIMATYSIKEFKYNNLSYVFRHSPTLHIAPELLIDPYWRKLITECMIPVALTTKVRLGDCNRSIPKKYSKVIQNVDVKVHELSQFVLPVRMPSLTTDISKELTAATIDLTELPEVMF